MKFKLDEDMSLELAVELRDRGYDSDTVDVKGLRGAKDPFVVEAVFAAGRILLSFDSGIANLRQFPLGGHAGVVLFRPCWRSFASGCAIFSTQISADA